MKSIYLKWNDMKCKYVTKEEYNELLRSTRGKKYLTEIRRQDVGGIFRFTNTYQVVKTQSSLELRIDNGEEFQRYMCILRATDKVIEDLNSGSGSTGQDGYKHINAQFKEQYGISIYSALSGSKCFDDYTDIKKCVPAPINYANDLFMYKTVENCFESDESSAYPSKLVRSVPTLHSAKRVKGYAEPTEEYPFAFYIKSKHIKILNELDTRKFKSKFYKDYFRKYQDAIKPEDEITILCKASKYSFAEIMKTMYNKRKEQPIFKSYMNCFIGYCQKNNDPNLCQISAVVIARCIKIMLERAEQLEMEGNSILMINTDAIIWTGKQSSLSVKEKSLGAFVAEYENVKICYKGSKAYQILTSDGIVITKMSGKTKDKQQAMKFGDVLGEPETELTNNYYVNCHGYIKEFV